MAGKKVTVEVISDIVCPWCWVGKRAIEAGAAKAGVELELHWKPFQLNPHSPVEGEDKMEAYIRKFGPDAKRFLLDQNNHLYTRGREVGANMRYVEGSKVFNTFPAHHLIHWAEKEHGPKRANDLHEVLFRKYFNEGLNLGPKDELLKAVKEVGLPVEDAEKAMEAKKYADEVNKELRQSHRTCSGVPHFTFPNGHTISGGQEVDHFAAILAELADS